MTRRRNPGPHCSRLLFDRDGLKVGRFVCPADDRGFGQPSQIPLTQIVFPCTPVMVRRASGRRFLADPTVAGLYRRGEEYERESVARQGDRHYWIGFADDPEYFPPPGQREFLPQFSGFRSRQTFFWRLECGRTPDPLDVEETAISLLENMNWGPAANRGRRSRYAHVDREHVEAVKRRIAARPDERITLSRLAADVALTPFTLYRAFRAITGTTIYRYSREMRLRLAWTMLQDGADSITAVALAAGFCSHSHFTDTFRRRFGYPPRSHPARA